MPEQIQDLSELDLLELEKRRAFCERYEPYWGAVEPYLEGDEQIVKLGEAFTQDPKVQDAVAAEFLQIYRAEAETEVQPLTFQSLVQLEDPRPVLHANEFAELLTKLDRDIRETGKAQRQEYLALVSNNSKQAAALAAIDAERDQLGEGWQTDGDEKSPSFVRVEDVYLAKYGGLSRRQYEALHPDLRRQLNRIVEEEQQSKPAAFSLGAEKHKPVDFRDARWQQKRKSRISQAKSAPKSEVPIVEPDSKPTVEMASPLSIRVQKATRKRKAKAQHPTIEPVDKPPKRFHRRLRRSPWFNDDATAQDETKIDAAAAPNTPPSEMAENEHQPGEVAGPHQQDHAGGVTDEADVPVPNADAVQDDRRDVWSRQQHVASLRRRFEQLEEADRDDRPKKLCREKSEDDTKKARELLKKRTEMKTNKRIEKRLEIRRKERFPEPRG